MPTDIYFTKYFSFSILACFMIEWIVVIVRSVVTIGGILFRVFLCVFVAVRGVSTALSRHAYLLFKGSPGWDCVCVECIVSMCCVVRCIFLFE